MVAMMAAAGVAGFPGCRNGRRGGGAGLPVRYPPDRRAADRHNPCRRDVHDLTAGHSGDNTRHLALPHRALDYLINPGERRPVPVEVAHAARL